MGSVKRRDPKRTVTAEGVTARYREAGFYDIGSGDSYLHKHQCNRLCCPCFAQSLYIPCPLKLVLPRVCHAARHPLSQPCPAAARSVSALFYSDAIAHGFLGLVLPTPSMQNQMHELAKTLPPPRKQNTACDACRSANQLVSLRHAHITLCIDLARSSAIGCPVRTR